MTKLELCLELANLAGLTEKAKVEAVNRMTGAPKEICQRRYDKVMAEANKEQAAKYVVMCCTGIIPNGIDRYCTPIH